MAIIIHLPRRAGSPARLGSRQAAAHVEMKRLLVFVNYLALLLNPGPELGVMSGRAKSIGTKCTAGGDDQLLVQVTAEWGDVRIPQ